MSDKWIAFKGNRFLKYFCYVMCYGTMAFACYMLARSPDPTQNPSEIIAWLLFCSFPFIFFGLMSHYFLFSKEVIRIKNHVWFWKNTEHSFDKILEVAYTSRPK